MGILVNLYFRIFKKYKVCVFNLGKKKFRMSVIIVNNFFFFGVNSGWLFMF